MPDYYIMDLHKGIAETMAAEMPSRQQIADCTWMTEEDLRVYSSEFTRTGFQGGLNYYRVANDASLGAELKAFSGRTIDVPACYIGGDRDWATHQSPGAFESMRTVCSQLWGGAPDCASGSLPCRGAAAGGQCSAAGFSNHCAYSERISREDHGEPHLDQQKGSKHHCSKHVRFADRERLHNISSSRYAGRARRC